jgi:hypothetical protein
MQRVALFVAGLLFAIAGILAAGQLGGASISDVLALVAFGLLALVASMFP